LNCQQKGLYPYTYYDGGGDDNDDDHRHHQTFIGLFGVIFLYNTFSTDILTAHTVGQRSIMTLI